MRTLFVLAGLLAATLSVPTTARAQPADADLTHRAMAKVRDYVHFTIFDDVNIAVINRAVTLTGRVTMPFKRDEIGARVARVDGIRSLVNDIQVLPVSNGDATLRVRAAQAIYGNPSFWQYASMANPPIHIVVEHGRITLTGCVNSEVERMLAYALAQVDGALSVKNDLRLERK